jgi:hypothetical protein
MLASPPGIITDTPAEWVRFIGFAQNPNLPFIDVDVVAELVIDALHMETVSDDCLSNLANQCAYGEALFSNTDEHFTQGQRDDVFNEIVVLGNAISKQLQELKAYDASGTLNYRLQRVVGLHTFVYAKK